MQHQNKEQKPYLWRLGDEMDGYYYLHTKGSLIWKNAVVVDSDPQYFDSPFVKRWWKVDLKNREGAWKIVLEALALGCPVQRIKELAEKWKLDYRDSVEMIQRVRPSKEMKDGLKIFIKEIFSMEPDDYWEKVRNEQQG